MLITDAHTDTHTHTHTHMQIYQTLKMSYLDSGDLIMRQNLHFENLTKKKNTFSAIS